MSHACPEPILLYTMMQLKNLHNKTNTKSTENNEFSRLCDRSGVYVGFSLFMVSISLGYKRLAFVCRDQLVTTQYLPFINRTSSAHVKAVL